MMFLLQGDAAELMYFVESGRVRIAMVNKVVYLVALVDLNLF